MRDALLKTRVISCLSDVLEQLQNEKFIRSNIAKQILNNSCEAMHEILDNTENNLNSNSNNESYLDSDINIEGKMLFHRFHKRKWHICVSSNKIRIIKLNKYQRIMQPADILLEGNHKILIQATDCNECKLSDVKAYETTNNNFYASIKREKY